MKTAHNKIQLLFQKAGYLFLGVVTCTLLLTSWNAGAATVCKVTSGADITVAPSTFRATIAAFNRDWDNPSLQFCHNIALSTDITLSQTPITITGTGNSEKPLVIDGGGHAIDAHLVTNSKNGCAITISGKANYTTIKNLKLSYGGICVDKGINNVNFENVIVENSPGNGFRIEENTNNIVIGKGCMSIQSNMHGIHFLSDMAGKGSNIYFGYVQDPANPTKLVVDPYSVSVFHNAKNEKDPEGRPYLDIKTNSYSGITIDTNALKITPTSIFGFIKLPQDFQYAEGLSVLAYRSKAGVGEGKIQVPAGTTTFIGSGKVTSNVFTISVLGVLSADKGEYITLVPVWSKAATSAVFGSSTEKIQVKFTTGGAYYTPSGSGSGQSSSATSDAAIKLSDGTEILIPKSIIYGFKDTQDCLNKRNIEYAGGVGMTLGSIDSDGDGISDIIEDRNNNCIADEGETNWADPDTDDDGLLDGEEDQDGNGYATCYQKCEKSATDCTNVLNPKDNQTYAVKEFTVDKTSSGVACTLKSSSDPIRGYEECKGKKNVLQGNGLPTGFDKSKDFCVETFAGVGIGKDTDEDGIPDGRELRANIYNPLNKSYLYKLYDNEKIMVSSSNGQSTAVECSGSDIGRTAVKIHMKGKTKVMKNGAEVEEEVDVDVWRLCINDSVKPTAEVGSYRFGQKNNGQTNPFNPDSDGDQFCDGTPGSSGCLSIMGVKAQQDNCPTISDSSNVCPMSCVKGGIYAMIKPEVLQDLKNAVAQFTGTKKGDLVKKLEDINGGPLSDIDNDNIPDIVEDPNAECNFLAKDQLSTNPYVADTDGDGINDALDPCPSFVKNDPATLLPVPGQNGKVDESCVMTVVENKECSDKNQVTYKLQQEDRYTKRRAMYCFMDWDKDGIPNCEENTDLSKDTIESNETFTLSSDSDCDGLTDQIERDPQVKTNPRARDTDADGSDDATELGLDGNASSLHIQLMTGTVGCYTEKGKNGEIANLQMPLAGDTDPTNKDTDGDGILDGMETGKGSLTNPLNPDSDGDGLCDGNVDVTPFCIAGENLKLGTEYPHYPESAAEAANVATLNDYLNRGFDAWDNGVHSSNPCSTDTDHDGLPDYVKGGQGNVDPVKNNPNKNASVVTKFGADTDGDGIPDSIEINQLGTDPSKADSDGDSLEDGCIKIGTPQMRGELCAHLINNQPDFNGLGKGPGKAFNRNMGDTDPLNSDTDFDGMKDGDELAYPDGNVKSAYVKDDKGSQTYVGFYQKGVNLNPLREDTDGDGILDGIEAGARFKSNGIGVCKDNFCCYLNGVEAVKAGNLDPAFAANSIYVEGANTNALMKDTDGDQLQDGSQVTSYQPRNNWGEDLNCNGLVDKDEKGNLTESNPLFADSNHDGISDKDAICRNGICDPSINIPYVYAQQAGSGCSNTMMPGATLPATPADVATLLMMLSPLGLALRMRMRRK